MAQLFVESNVTKFTLHTENLCIDTTIIYKAITSI